MTLDAAALTATIDEYWEHQALEAIGTYTRIPCLSPAFATDWKEAGHLERAATFLADFARGRALPGLTAKTVSLEGRTPVVLLEAPPTPGSRNDDVTLIYGHLDKQPPQGTWREGLGPYEPVRVGDRLYGRGTGDDGYSIFGALGALIALHRHQVPHGRVVVLIEGSEESGSPDLPAYLDDLAPSIGTPRLVICLDSGCLTYDRLWLTDSLRGNLVFTLRVDVLEEGIHSGRSGAGVPSSFRVLRQLLSRIEDEQTGEILVPELRAEVPARHRANLAEIAAEFPDASRAEFPAVDGLELMGADEADRLVGLGWSTALSVTGVEGIPPVAQAGNVLRPFTEIKGSLRLPPTVNADRAATVLTEILTADPPYGARVTIGIETPADGWVATEPEPWLRAALEEASIASFGVPPRWIGEGGTIPFMAELGGRFPGTQFVATGVLGPESNAHAANEFLHLPMAKGVTNALSHCLAALEAVPPGPADGLA